MVVTSVYSYAIMLKLDAWWIRFSRHSSAHRPTASTNSTTAILDAFFPAPSSGLLHHNLQLNEWVCQKLVVWGMWRWARKWVQQIRALIAILLFNFSRSPICWSCRTIDPSCSALAAATSDSHDWMWMSLCAWVFIFSIAFFQFLNGLEIHVPPVLWREIPLVLQTLQKVPWKFHQMSAK